MNILFLTIGRFESIESHSIYADLMRCFRDKGHNIYIISPYEKRTGKTTEYKKEENTYILHVKTGNVTGASNRISKGLAQIMLEKIYINAVKKYYFDVKFDLVMYSTPPITFCKVVEYVKKRDGAKSYLLLKDIFPQNAVDLGMISQNGVRGIIYKYFRRKEIKLYKSSDFIGCMSKENVKYILKHNPYIDSQKVEICPNAIEVIDQSVNSETRKFIREKYDIPQDKIIFIYGGNLGKPQGIPFFIECLRRVKDINEAFFLIIGSGNYYEKMHEYIEIEKPQNIKLLNLLPKEDYDSMVGACDVGLVLLDHRFTIPNFPSRILAYMQAKLPVLAATDPVSDIGKVIEEGGFGWWCESDNPEMFTQIVKQIVSTGVDSEIKNKKEKSYQYLNENYNVERVYKTVYKNVSS